MKRQLGVVAALVGGLGLVLVLATQMVGKPPAEVKEGGRAPDFSATTLDQTPQARSMANYRGQVVLVNVWATWCGPCRVEMPSMQRLHEKLGPKGLKVVAVAVDDVGNEQRVRDFVARLGLGFDILHDPSGRIEQDWQAFGIPSSYVIDKKGVIRRFERGAIEWDTPEVVAFVEGLLTERGGD
ncbi:MAG: TlpA disulfide reductase family protein [Gemmatimonadaceae bacterium]|nr:TlpA disulfide reductase family protein [Gemmatimonadaceae bacterium]